VLRASKNKLVTLNHNLIYKRFVFVPSNFVNRFVAGAYPFGAYGRLEEEEKSAISDGMKALALFVDSEHHTVEVRGDVVRGNNNDGDDDDYDFFSLISNKFSFMNSKYYH